MSMPGEFEVPSNGDPTWDDTQPFRTRAPALSGGWNGPSESSGPTPVDSSSNNSPSPLPRAPGNLRAESSYTRQEFAMALLREIGAPTDDGTVGAILAWMNSEGTRAGYNPLATTLSSFDGQGATTFNYNTDGSPLVRNYASFEQGLRATVITIKHSRYNPVTAALRRGTTIHELGPLVGDSDWGSPDFSGRTAEGGDLFLGGGEGEGGSEEGRNLDGTNSNVDIDRIIQDLWEGGDIPENVQWGELPPELQDAVMKHHGYASTYLQDEELGPILIRSGLLEQADDLIAGLIRDTDWWARSDIAQRQWEELNFSDKGEADSKRTTQRAFLNDVAGQKGVPLSEEQMVALVEESLSMNWNELQIIDAIVGESFFDPDGEDEQELGDLRTFSENIQTMASRYMLSYSPSVMQEYSRQIAVGELEEEDLRSQFISDAKGRFPHFAGQLDKGYSITQLMDTRANEVGRILGMDPEEVDFMDDPRFQGILEFEPGLGEGTRAMNLMETRKHLAQLPEYEYTADAHARGSSLASTLLKKFGAV